MPVIPLIATLPALATSGAVLAGLYLGYKNVDGIRKAIDSSTDFFHKVEKPLIVFSVVAGFIYLNERGIKRRRR